jgi:hypothetical protein
MGVLEKQRLNWTGLDASMRGKSKSGRSRRGGEVGCIADAGLSAYLPVPDFGKPGWSWWGCILPKIEE